MTGFDTCVRVSAGRPGSRRSASGRGTPRGRRPAARSIAARSAGHAASSGSASTSARASSRARSITAPSLDDAQEPQRAPAAGLRRAEHVALAAQLEVDARELEPVGGRRERARGAARRRCPRGRRRRAGRARARSRARRGRAAGAAARARTRGRRGSTITVAAGTSTPDLDDRRGHQHGGAAGREVGDRPVLLLARHAAVQEADLDTAQPGVVPQGLDDLEHRAQRPLRRRALRRPGPRRRSSARRGSGPRRRSPAARRGAVVVARRSARTRRRRGRRAPTSSRTRRHVRSIHAGLSAGTTCVVTPLRPAGTSRSSEISSSPNTVIATVRGIGVAVVTSRCGAFAALARSASRCSTPNLCCSSITTSPRSANCTGSDSSACVPTTIPACPLAASSRLLRRSAAFCGAGQQRDPRADLGAAEHPALRQVAEQRAQRAGVLRGEHRRRGEQRGLAARVDHLEHRAQRDDRLARADLALQQPLHRVRARRGPRRSARRPRRWPVGERERQPRVERVEQAAGPRAGGPSTPPAAARARRRASSACRTNASS